MIIQSLLDTDLYKFTMMQVVLHHFPAAQVAYRFKCRTPGIALAPYIEEIRAEIHALCQLKFTHSELNYLRQLRYLKTDFIEFLGLFHLPENCIHVSVDENDPQGIDIRVQGSWLHTILFEIPVLAIVNEVYFKNTAPQYDLSEGRQRLQQKIRMVRDSSSAQGLTIADYGTRRRFSKKWHEEVLQTLQQQMPVHFAGTSNVYFAMLQGLRPLGTMAHEYLQACQSLGPRLRDSQTFAFETWAKEYRGDLGIALSDVYGMSAFLRDFDLYFCKLFDGARHDSGDPFEWGERLIAHYESLRVDPKSKTLVFSDNLNFTRVLELFERFKGRCIPAFGIGTNLTNDVGCVPLQIVMKMVECNGQPVAKLSDAPEKTMCDDVAYLTYLRQVFEIEAPK